jgi:putative membrane protein
MRQINFLLMFALGLALVLFALENTNSATIQILPNQTVEAPIAIELIVAMGVGAILAWLFSLWTNIQSTLEFSNKNRQISQLQKQISTLTAEVQERKQLMSANAIDVEIAEKTE